MEPRESSEALKRYGVEYYKEPPLLPELELLIKDSNIFTDAMEARGITRRVQEIVASFGEGADAVLKMRESDPRLRARAKQAAWAGQMTEILQKSKPNIIRQVYKFFQDESRLYPEYQGIMGEILAARLLKREEFMVMDPHPLLDAGAGVDLLSYRKDEKAEKHLAVQVKTHPYKSAIEGGEITQEKLEEWKRDSSNPREDKNYQSMLHCFLATGAMSAIDKVSVTPVFIIMPSLGTLEEEAAETREPAFHPYTFTPSQLLIDKWNKITYFKKTHG